MEGNPNPDIESLKEQIGELSTKIDVLEQSMKTQKAQLDGDIRELGAEVRSDIDHLKRLVYGVIVVFLVSVAAAFIGRLLGYI